MSVISLSIFLWCPSPNLAFFSNRNLWHDVKLIAPILHIFQAKIVRNDDNELTYRTTDPPRDVHVKMLQENIDTLEKVFNYVAKTYTSKRCLGTRQILSEEDEVQPNGRVFKKYNLGDYKWKTFTEAERTAANFGRGLRELGQKPRENIVIFAETRAEWMIAAHGCFKQAMPIVTVYATLGDDGVAHCEYTA